MEYYHKEILSNSVLVHGRAVSFENIGANRGVIALDPATPESGDTIAELNRLAERGIGGVTKISEAEYAQKKSNPVSTPSGRPREMLRPRPNPFPVAKPSAPAAPVAAPPAVEPPKPVAQPHFIPSAQPAAPAGEADPDFSNFKAVNETAAPAAPPVPPAPGQSFQPPTRRIGRPRKDAAKAQPQ